MNKHRKFILFDEDTKRHYNLLQKEEHESNAILQCFYDKSDSVDAERCETAV